MQREKKQLWLTVILVVIILIIAAICWWFAKQAAEAGLPSNVPPSEEAAEAAAKAYAEAIDYDYEHPSAIYQWMTNDYKASISEDDFNAAFKKERSYPYLTPLFINYDHVELSEDLMTGKAVYSQAARLPGMIYEVGLVYEDGTYHVEDFETFPDGSYLEKFDTVTYDLSSYFSDIESEGRKEEE